MISRTAPGSPERLEILDYLMGVNLSELNWIGGRVNREMTSTPADVTDYFAAKDAGVELPESEYDRGDLLELVRFTADALHDADTIREEASELQQLVLGALHAVSDPCGRDDPAWVAYRRVSARDTLSAPVFSELQKRPPTAENAGARR